MFDAGADFDFAAAFAVVVVGEIGDAAGGEIGVNIYYLSLKKYLNCSELRQFLHLRDGDSAAFRNYTRNLKRWQRAFAD